MAELPPLRQEILVNAAQALVAMEQVVAGLRGVGLAAEQTTLKTAKVGSGLGSLFKSAALIAGITAVGGAIRAVAEDMAAEEVAQANLNVAMDNSLNVTNEQRQSITDLADSYEQLGFSGDDARTAMSQLITATGDVTQSTNLMIMSADLARFKHITLAQASALLTKAAMGNEKAFKQMGITLDSTLPKSQAISRAFDELNGKIGGAAAAATDTFAVKLAILRERMVNVGTAIAKQVEPFLAKVVGWLEYAVAWIGKNIEFIKALIIILGVLYAALKLIAIIEAVIDGLDPFTWIMIAAVALIALLVVMWNKFRWVRIAISGMIGTVIMEFGYLIGLMSTFLRLLSHIPGLGFLEAVADKGDKAAKSIGEVSKKAMELANLKLEAPDMPKIPNTNLDPNAKINALTGLETSGGGSGSGTTQFVTVYASNTNDIAKKLAKAAKNGLPIGGH